MSSPKLWKTKAIKTIPWGLTPGTGPRNWRQFFMKKRNKNIAYIDGANLYGGVAGLETKEDFNKWYKKAKAALLGTASQVISRPTGYFRTSPAGLAHGKLYLDSPSSASIFWNIAQYRSKNPSFGPQFGWGQKHVSKYYIKL